MDDRARRAATILHQAAETHHVVYAITDGDDPDWASWYATWLLDLSELPGVLGTPPVRSHLVYELVRLEREVGAGSGWEDRYAAELVARFGGAPGA
jgi:hypothetical protein